MLSICIPVYNYDVTALVLELIIQCEQAGVQYEVLLMDDASTEAYRDFNRALASLTRVRYIELAQNVGRSGIRNLLADLARFEYLLFMDCDSKPPTAQFIKNYLVHLPTDKVICGGRSYADKPAVPVEQLRWQYGCARECSTAATRNAQPYQGFMSNNFIVPKIIFKNLRFNEQLSGYGHEDTLFGYELKRQKAGILHIDNPLLHIGLESAPQFIKKTEQGLSNLVTLYRRYAREQDFVESIKLLRYFHRLRRLKLLPLIHLVYKYQNKKLLQTLLSDNPSLQAFDTYKLLTFVHLYCQKK